MTLEEIRSQTVVQRALGLPQVNTIITPAGLTMVRFKSTAERRHLAEVILSLRRLSDMQIPLVGVDRLLAVSDAEKLGGILGSAVASDMALDMVEFAQQIADSLEEVLGQMEAQRVPADLDMEIVGVVTNLQDHKATVEGLAA
jgi:hypothetical protein